VSDIDEDEDYERDENAGLAEDEPSGDAGEAGLLDFRPRDERAQRPPRQPVAVEHHLWTHSIESSALVALSMLAGAYFINRTSLSWAVIMLPGAVLTAVTWWVSLTATGSLVMANYLGAWGAFATAWLTTARFTGLWHTPLILALITGSLVLAPTGALAIGHHRGKLRRAALARTAQDSGADLQRWKIRFVRHGVPNVDILEVLRFAGETQVHGRLGKATDLMRAPTFAALEAITGPLAVDARVSPDCVYFQQGRTAADFVLHLRDKATRREVVPLPRDNSPTTINEKMAIGVQDNGREYKMLLREVSTMIVGVRGSGKSNLLNVFLTLLARHMDCLIFMIDLKGGRTARPWFEPWVQGDCDRPVIDWLATTREEAKMMIEALNRAGNARAESGEGWEKITPTKDTPAIILVCDETAIMTGHGTRKDGVSNYNIAMELATLVETFRSEAIDYLGSALRANVDIMGSTAVKSQSEVRIGLRVTSVGDGMSIFPDHPDQAKRLAALRDKGDGIVKYGADFSPAVHFYRVGSRKRILDTARATGNHRPAPEQRIVEAMGEAYTERWNREHGQRLLSAWRRDIGLPGRAPGDEPEADVDDEFAEIISHSWKEDPEKPPHASRKRMWQLIHSKGMNGLSVARITAILDSEGLNVRRETIQRWLKDDESRGLVQRTGAPVHRWVWIGRGESNELLR